MRTKNQLYRIEALRGVDRQMIVRNKEEERIIQLTVR
jgi:hypothetical protein